MTLADFLTVFVRTRPYVPQINQLVSQFNELKLDCNIVDLRTIFAVTFDVEIELWWIGRGLFAWKKFVGPTPEYGVLKKLWRYSIILAKYFRHEMKS